MKSWLLALCWSLRASYLWAVLMRVPVGHPEFQRVLREWTRARIRLESHVRQRRSH